MKDQNFTQEAEEGMQLSSLIGGRAVLFCGPQTTPSEEAQLRNGLANQGINLPKPNRLSVEFGCKVVSEQLVQSDMTNSPSFTPVPALAPATP